MAEKGLAGIRRRIRLELEQGRTIGFVGWRDHYHDDFTRSIPQEKVVFARSEAPPAHVAFIFFTRMVNATKRGRIADKRAVVNEPLEPHEIKNLLKEFTHLLAPPAGGATRAPQTASAETDDYILDLLTKPQELSAMEKFVQAFRIEAAKNNGYVTSMALAALLRDHASLTTPKLVKEKWVIPEKAEGKSKVGRYRAGPKMEELEQKSIILPDNVYDRMRFYVDKKDALDVRKAQLETDLAEVNRELNLIERVKKMAEAFDDEIKK
ncbi:MAG: hypothetical protein WA021_00380 [Minisyncoccia bacterium]